MDLTTLLALPPADIRQLKNSSRIAQQIEDYWASRVEQALMDLVAPTIASFAERERPPEIDLEDLFIQHSFDVAVRAMQLAAGMEEARLPIAYHLARYPVSKIPKTLAELMRLYDAYRKGKYKPKRAVAQAKAVKKAYLEKVSSVWEKHSEDFRSGEVGTQELVIEQVREAARTTASRAKNIVRTETTNYYNKARKEFYDESPDITHYLFIAIRDASTSPWCTPLTIRGYRGRSGLVYAKDDPLLDAERPACHPGCRSEIVPLNRLNPAHLRFIQDYKIQRRNVRCYPLLKGWRAA